MKRYTREILATLRASVDAIQSPPPPPGLTAKQIVEDQHMAEKIWAKRRLKVPWEVIAEHLRPLGLKLSGATIKTYVPPERLVRSRAMAAKAAVETAAAPSEPSPLPASSATEPAESSVSEAAKAAQIRLAAAAAAGEGGRDRDPLTTTSPLPRIAEL